VRGLNRVGHTIARVVILIVLLGLLLACGDSDTGSLLYNIPDKEPNMVTPLGYDAYIPVMYALYTRGNIFFGAPIVRAIVTDWLDIRIEDTILAHPDIKNARSIAKAKVYILYNHYMFPCGSSSGMCYGRTDMIKYIEGVIYARWRGDEYPAFQTNPDLIKTKEYFYNLTGVKGWLTEGGNYYASDLYPDGMGLLVIKHELEHCFYGPSYGHSNENVFKERSID